MSFFDGRMPEPEPPPQRHVQPIWAGPQQGTVPGRSNQRAFLFRSDRHVFVIDGIDVFPNGVSFRATLWDREPEDDQRHMHAELGAHWPKADDVLRLGLLFDDGSSWSTLDRNRYRYPIEPERPYVTAQGSGGGPDRYSWRFWIWPVPDGGKLTFIAEWPKHEIAECRASIDLEEVRSLLSETEPVWP